MHFGVMDVISLRCAQQHVSTSHVAVFWVVTTMQ